MSLRTSLQAKPLHSYTSFGSGGDSWVRMNLETFDGREVKAFPVGLKDEFDDLKFQIKNLEFYDCKDFLELASIIRSSKLFIGNLSFGFAIAEALKVPRLLESAPNFPLVYPNGNYGYDFYFQVHFEELVEKLYKLK